MIRPLAIALLAGAVTAGSVAAAAPSRAPALLHADVTGDGVADAVARRGAFLVVTTEFGEMSTALPGRLDGAIHVRGMGGELLLVRVGNDQFGFTDAVYAAHNGRLRRLHVVGSAGDGFATRLAGATYSDLDCGAAAGTIVQMEIEPVGTRWRRTEFTFALDARGFVLVGVMRQTVSAAQATHRRCAVERR